MTAKNRSRKCTVPNGIFSNSNYARTEPRSKPGLRDTNPVASLVIYSTDNGCSLNKILRYGLTNPNRHTNHANSGLGAQVFWFVTLCRVAYNIVTDVLVEPI
jgi:hypothetical protein